MGAEWKYFKNDGFGDREIKVSIHDNYVTITDNRIYASVPDNEINALYLELTFHEAIRLAKFLMRKIHTGENEHED